MKRQSIDDLLSEGFLTVKEASQELRVPLSTVYRWVQAGVLTHTRLGKHIMISRRALKQYTLANLRLGRVA